MSEEKKTTEEQTNEEVKGFWAKNIVSILLIVFLIISGIYAFNRDTSKDQEKDVEKKVSEIKNSDSEKTEENITSENPVSEENPEKKEMTNPVETTDESITVSAIDGDGATHLARKAIAEYSTKENISLSKEQKLYAETVLKNSYYQHHLSVGQSIAFSITDLSDTIQKAQDLSEHQIKAWSKYTSSVPNL